MRFSLPVIAVALVFSTVSSVGLGRAVATASNPRSLALVHQAEVVIAQGRLNTAIDLLETALAVDPSNRAAYILLGQVAHQQQLDGKAIRYYSLALAMDKADVLALSGQGQAYASKGAIQRAKDNLAQLRLLCGSKCPSGDKLQQAIQQAQIEPVRSASAVKPETLVEQENP